MHFEVITLFPDSFASFLASSLLGKAIEAGHVHVSFTDPRDFAHNRHNKVDDTPYGGGAGMVMRVPPVVEAVEHALATRGPAHRVLLAPVGTPLDHKKVQELSAMPRLVLVCGRYEGIDDRVRELCIDEIISLGDFVLSGGEVAAMTVIDAVSRLLPGVVGTTESVHDESFADGMLEYPHYTRPPEYRGLSVPDVLLSGNHAEIKKWRAQQSIERTKQWRPELLDKKDRS